MKLLVRKDLDLKAFFLDIPGDNNLFGNFERTIRNSFTFDDPSILPMRTFQPVSRKGRDFNLVVSVLKLEVSKFYTVVKKFCKEYQLDFESLLLTCRKKKVK